MAHLIACHKLYHTNACQTYVQVCASNGSVAIEFVSIEWNSIKLGGSTHGIVTKTVPKTLPSGGG